MPSMQQQPLRQKELFFSSLVIELNIKITKTIWLAQNIAISTNNAHSFILLHKKTKKAATRDSATAMIGEDESRMSYFLLSLQHLPSAF
jgi:hypothetical protein